MHDRDEPHNLEAQVLKNSQEDSNPPLACNKDNNVQLGEALASPNTVSCPWEIKDVKWNQQVIVGYSEDTLLMKVLEHLEDYKAFRVLKKLIWTRNLAGIEVLCVS